MAPIAASTSTDLVTAFVPLFVIIAVLMLVLFFVRSRGRERREKLGSDARRPTPPAPVPPPPQSEGPAEAAPGTPIAGLPVVIRPEELPLAPDDPRLAILAQHLSREDLRRAGFPVPPDMRFDEESDAPEA